MSLVSVSDVDVLIMKSEEFAKKNKFGSTTTTTKELQGKGIEDGELLLNANSAYPIIHHRVLDLIVKFIKLKQQHGSNVEKLVYKASLLEVFNFPHALSSGYICGCFRRPSYCQETSCICWAS